MPTHHEQFDAAFATCPLIAILRGIKPDEAEAIGEALVCAGINIIEVPLNSPDPFESIARLAKSLTGRAIVGAGTVLRRSEVDRVAECGGTLIVSPNANSDVIAHTKFLGLVSAPGALTPTEAFSALDSGADILKLFPGEMMPPEGVKALSAVLPKQARMVLVGGVSEASFSAYCDTQLAGFGFGSSLFRPGRTAPEIEMRATRLVNAWQNTRRHMDGPRRDE
ncbi:MAG: 2-dehydro-3-deoxy-6-phosphogalactonate aldolase [Hyphomicrobiales bacterium]